MAKLMTEAWHDGTWSLHFKPSLVNVCLILQPTGKTMPDLMSKREDSGEHHSSVPTLMSELELATCYKWNEGEKRHAYEYRVREVEQGSFTPLEFSTSGGMGRAAIVAYKRLVILIAAKREQPSFWLVVQEGHIPTLSQLNIFCNYISSQNCLTNYSTYSV